MNPFKDIADSLNIEAAVRRGSRPNDLLPPRLEDSVLGETSKRFSEGLRNRIERGRYDPLRASIVYVPKPGFTTRAAALLTLDDRVMYEAIVARLRDRIETALMGEGIAFWPRGDVNKQKQWRDFEVSPLKNDVTHVVLTDVTGFYESIDHEMLRDVLVECTGRRKEVDALIDFLGRVMGASQGLPQGVDPSDQLATAFLAPADRAMAKAFSYYSRHGDDFRVGTTSYAMARRALHSLECHIRQLGLLLNSSKCAVLRRETYEREMQTRDDHINATREALFSERAESLEEGDGDTIEELLARAEKEELGWGFFYHGNVTLAELIAELSDFIKPSDVEVAEAVFQDAMSQMEGSGLSAEEVHQRITFAILRMTAGKSPAALAEMPALLRRHPEKAELIANYLQALSQSEASDIATIVKDLVEDSYYYKTSWAMAWMLRVLEQTPHELDPSITSFCHSAAANEDEEWIMRVAAARLLGKAGELERDLVYRLWNRAPRAFQTDLTAAVWWMKDESDWPIIFLDSLADDVLSVVKRHLERED